jgi:hypothetical protein
MTAYRHSIGYDYNSIARDHLDRLLSAAASSRRVREARRARRSVHRSSAVTSFGGAGPEAA